VRSDVLVTINALFRFCLRLPTLGLGASISIASGISLWINKLASGAGDGGGDDADEENPGRNPRIVSSSVGEAVEDRPSTPESIDCIVGTVRLM